MHKCNYITMLFAFGVALGWGFCGQANQSTSWSPCDCDSETYTLTINTGNNGTVAKSPDKASYSKGESVIVSFTPNSDKLFAYWLCSPASHMASNCDAAVVAVFITGNTTLTAITRPKYYTLTCSWDKTKGTVALPSGGQAGDGTFTVPNLVYGSTLTLNATPNSGYYTWWQGGGSAPWAGTRYGNCVDVKIESSINLSAGFGLTSQYPTMNTLTVNTEGGSGQIYSAGCPTASFTSGPYPYNTAIAPGLFVFRATPAPGYDNSYLTWMAGGAQRYTTNPGMDSIAGGTYTARFTKKIKLNVETQGKGVVTSPSFKYQWNAEPYILQGLTNPPATSLTPLVNGNSVQMTATPCTGWRLDHWEYKNAAGDWVNAGTTTYKTIYMNWWTGTGIHVPNGTETFSVRAIFSPNLTLSHGYSATGPFLAVDPPYYMGLTPIYQDVQIGVVTGDTVTFYTGLCDTVWGGAASGTGSSATAQFNSAGASSVTASVGGVTRTAAVFACAVPPPTQAIWALQYPAQAIIADQTRQTAQAWGQEASMGGGWLNGRSNACVHSYWCALMTLRMGAAMALAASTAHEYSGLAEQPHNATAMDMWNNQLGVNIGGTFAGSDLVYCWEVRNAIIGALNDGEFLMLTNQDEDNALGLLIPTNSVVLNNTPTPTEPPHWRDPGQPGEIIIPV